MNKFFKYLLIVLLFQLFSCNNKYKTESSEFNDYLYKSFKEEIPENPHTYIIISRFKCKGCVQKTLLEINSFISSNSIQFITLITGNLKDIPTSLKNKVKIKVDINYGFEEIGLDIANTTLIKTESGRIITIKVINLNEIDKIVNEEFMEYTEPNNN